MVVWPVLLASVTGGWAAGARWGARGIARVLLALTIGVGLTLCWLLLLSLWLPPLPSAVVAALLAVASGVALGRTRLNRQISNLRWPFWLLGFLASLVAWLCMIGGNQLHPNPSFLRFDLPWTAGLNEQGALTTHPLGSQALEQVSRFATAAALGGDPWQLSLTLAGVFQLLAVWGWLLLLAAANPKAPLAVLLGGLALFLGTAEGWLVSSTPWHGAAHLLTVTALWLGWRDRSVALLPVLLALALLTPSLALALALGLLLPFPGRRAWLAAATGLLVGVALAGWGPGLVAAALLYGSRPSHALVPTLCLAEFFAPGLFGLAALGVVVGRWLAWHWKRCPGGRLRYRRGAGSSGGLEIPRRLLLACIAASALWWAMASGEEAFNDDILIAAQKEKMPVWGLLYPLRLADWAAWRGSVVGFAPTDLAAVDELRSLSGAALYLTGSPQEPVEVSALLSALAGGRELAGWYLAQDGDALLPAAAAVAATGDPESLRGSPVRWLLRRGQPALAIEPLEPPPTAVGEVRPLRRERWGSLAWYAAPPGSRYDVRRDGVPYGQGFGVTTPPAGKVPFAVPKLPGTYTLHWSDGTVVSGGGEVGVDAQYGALPLRADLLDSEELPSRSLLPLVLRLSNQAAVELEIGDLQGVRFRLVSRSGEPDRLTPVTPLPGLRFGPRESRELTVFLKTAIAPDLMDVSVELLDVGGASHPVPLGEGALLRTWNRRPPLTLPDGILRHS